MAIKFVRYGNLKSTADVVGVGTSLYEPYRATAGKTVFTLVGDYRPGTNELKVHVNGVKMSVNIDYIETNASTVTFLEPMEEDELVIFQVDEVRNTSLHEEFVTSPGQTIFILSNPFRIGQYTLQTWYNGQLMRSGDDYMEDDSQTIRFLYPLPGGQKVTFHEVV